MKRSITQLETILQKKLDEYIKRFKKKPTPAEFRRYIARIDSDLANEMNSAVTSQMKRIYRGQKSIMEKELGVSLPITTADQLVVATITNTKAFSQSLAGIKNKTVDRLKEVFTEQFSSTDGLNTRELQRKIREVASVAESRAETIARTESNKITTAARRQSYLQADPTDSSLYYWTGPDDNTTTDVSRRIKKRTRMGVTWQELISIVQEEAVKMIPNWVVNPLAPISHPNSRHFPVRKQ